MQYRGQLQGAYVEGYAMHIHAHVHAHAHAHAHRAVLLQHDRVHMHIAHGRMRQKRSYLPKTNRTKKVFNNTNVSHVSQKKQAFIERLFYFRFFTISSTARKFLPISV